MAQAIISMEEYEEFCEWKTQADDLKLATELATVRGQIAFGEKVVEVCNSKTSPPEAMAPLLTIAKLWIDTGKSALRSIEKGIERDVT